MLTYYPFRAYPGCCVHPPDVTLVYILLVQLVLRLEPHWLPCNQRACCTLQSGADWQGGGGFSAYHFLTQQTLPVSFLHLLACLHVGWRGLAEFIASPWMGSLYHSQGLSLCSPALPDLVFSWSHHHSWVLWNWTAFYPWGLAWSPSCFMSSLWTQIDLCRCSVMVRGSCDPKVYWKGNVSTFPNSNSCTAYRFSNIHFTSRAACRLWLVSSPGSLMVTVPMATGIS